jgi:hypothetical protein
MCYGPPIFRFHHVFRALKVSLLGITTPNRSTAQHGTSPRQTQLIRHYEAPAHKPYRPQKHELSVSAKELKRLREQSATEDSKTTQ